MDRTSEYAVQALTLAKAKHCGQMYGEHEYIYHLKQVAASVYEAHADSIHVSVAYLHDILEDTDTTVELLQTWFPEEVVDAVVALTKIKGEKYSEYLDKVAANKIALEVKMHDTLCNLTESLRTEQWGRVRKYSEQMKLLAVYK